MYELVRPNLRMTMHQKNERVPKRAVLKKFKFDLSLVFA